MGRILSIDYGTKRVGIAVTDPMQIIATGLTTVHSKDIFDFLKKYLTNESVEKIIVGEPKNLDNTPTESAKEVNIFISKLRALFPILPIEQIDERFTSKMAFQSMIDSGMKKKDRQRKELIDEISATLILQSYMNKSIQK